MSWACCSLIVLVSGSTTPRAHASAARSAGDTVVSGVAL
jgi:hypothetical protein